MASVIKRANREIEKNMKKASALLSSAYELPTDRDYQDAIDVQNACNVSGVIRTLNDKMQRIWNEVRANGGGTAFVNRHPIVVLFATQIVHLATGDIIDGGRYGEAYAACEAKAKATATG